MAGLIRLHDIAREGGADRSIRRSVERGETVRVARGHYLCAQEWDALDSDTRYRARIRAFAETTRATQVFSHWSAAVLWGYPVIGRWPKQIHVTFASGNGQRSTPGVVRHITELSDEDVVELDGLFVTSPLRTLVDLARSATFATGVAAIDSALAERKPDADGVPLVDRDALLDRADRLNGQRGVRQLRAVIDFADGNSGSSGESFSRVQMARLRLPRPELQVEVVDLDGRTWHCDFGWKKYRTFGEFDGMVKYTRGRYLNGRDVADVVIEEKLREDAIRFASGCGMVRWIWPVASNPLQLKRLLAAAGLHPE